MKIGILFICMIATVNSRAQSLKDALFGGKLKSDSGTVVKKTDDLSKKIDTSRKITPVPEKTKPVSTVAVTSVTSTAASTDSAANPDKKDPAVASKDNTKIWKEFMDAAISTLNTEVMSSKKLKKGDYYMIVDYAIEPDGKVTINNVYPTPENKFLEEQVKERLGIDTPQLNPVLGSNGKGRRVIKRYNFTLTKN